METKKNKLVNIALILLCAGILIYLLVSSITDLTNTEDLHTTTLDGAFQILQLEHSINGLIPTGSDYYYVGIVEDTYDVYLIKSSKGWLKKNFADDYTALNSNGVQITGLAKEVSDSQVSRELETRLSQLEDVNYPLGQLCCLELDYKFNAILKLINFVLLIGLIITGVFIFKTKISGHSILVISWTVVLLISLGLLYKNLR